MAWRRPGDKPLSEPMMVRLPTHICVTRPQWFNLTTVLYNGNPHTWKDLLYIETGTWYLTCGAIPGTLPVQLYLPRKQPSSWRSHYARQTLRAEIGERTWGLVGPGDRNGVLFQMQARDKGDGCKTQWTPWVLVMILTARCKCTNWFCGYNIPKYVKLCFVFLWIHTVIDRHEVGTRFCSLIFPNMRLRNLVPTSRRYGTVVIHDTCH